MSQKVNINKSSQRAKEEARIQSRYDSERAEREETRHDQYTSRQRINAAKKNMVGGDAFGPEGKTRVRGEERKRYQFEATASDDEVEDEIEDNLGQFTPSCSSFRCLNSDIINS